MILYVFAEGLVTVTPPAVVTLLRAFSAFWILVISVLAVALQVMGAVVWEPKVSVNVPLLIFEVKTICWTAGRLTVPVWVVVSVEIPCPAGWKASGLTTIVGSGKAASVPLSVMVKTCALTLVTLNVPTPNALRAVWIFVAVVAPVVLYAMAVVTAPLNPRVKFPPVRPELNVRV